MMPDAVPQIGDFLDLTVKVRSCYLVRQMRKGRSQVLAPDCWIVTLMHQGNPKAEGQTSNNLPCFDLLTLADEPPGHQIDIVFALRLNYRKEVRRLPPIGAKFVGQPRAYPVSKPDLNRLDRYVERFADLCVPQFVRSTSRDATHVARRDLMRLDKSLI